MKAFQLEPLRKALLMPRVNLFIADSVGLGKTIEAGLILREMLMRQKVRRTVICCPPSVVRQWKDEMEQRFGLTFVIYDRDYVTAKRQDRGYSVNPWTTHSRFIVSQALIRNEIYAGALRDWLGEFQGGSLFILDEAHNAAPAGGTKYAIDSKLTRAVRDLTPASSTSSSCRRPRTMGTRTASRRSWRCSTRRSSARGEGASCLA